MNYPERRSTFLGAFITQILVIIPCLVVVLRLWKVDLRVPVEYWGDTLYFLSLTKSIAEGGWIWTISRLGAPFSFEAVAFPVNITFSSLVIKMIALFTSSPAIILNLFWIFSILLTSCLAHWSLRVLGVSFASAVVFGSLYALLPFTLYRNIAHINLTFIFIPILSAFAIQLGLKNIEIQENWQNTVFIAALCQGFDYVYNAFFASFFILMGALLGFARFRGMRRAKYTGIVIGLIVMAVAINLTPSLLSWSEHGKPPNMSYKSLAEAEVYGLKIRHLVSPVQPAAIPILQRYGQREQAFPHENENTTARLGFIGAVGFLIALTFGVIGGGVNNQIAGSIGGLTIVGILFATVGGFGTIFNLLVVPDIRCYNRIVVFLAFFAFATLALVIDGKLFQNNASWIVRLLPPGSRKRGLLLTGLLVLGVLDQGQAAKSFIDRHQVYKQQWKAERAFVRDVEARYALGIKVYQLPETSFPSDGGTVRMGPYDHARPYLWSEKFSWSWPSFSVLRDVWWRQLGSPEDQDFVERLIESGFDGLWLDRFGYVPEDLTRLEKQFEQVLGPPVAQDRTLRYSFYDLSPVKRHWAAKYSPEERLRRQARMLSPISIDFGHGFYGEEMNGPRRHRWSKQESHVVVKNMGNMERLVKLRAKLQAGGSGKLTIKGDGFERVIPLSSAATEFDLPLTLRPYSDTRLSIRFDGPRVDAPYDPRKLYFAVIDPVLEDEPSL